ncbi:serine/threonine-protein kinase [Sphaerisporangium perillae]|uniref:serine/threonine-protein kinase n=1 Tax=Sphaerisporangium perillae TaxID=2935860 RepID=UPI00200CE008|nr:serine/threonine-protein kinase [Sphaerisporangium perillae]
MLTRRYRLVEQIASGGMSAIWRAFDQSLHRAVAIKVLDGCVGGDHGGRDLIRREARATARLIHPDAIEVYDYGETVTARGRLAAYVVMRLLDGRPLSERIIDEGPLPWREAAVIGARVAMVLAAAHQRGIVHRDVTAENVLLTPEGAKLLDFGIAAFVGEEVDKRLDEFGTPPYVAPERLTGASVHPAVDVYALGVLIFEMLTGAPPYPETTWEALEAARRTGPPPVPCGVPGLPPEVAALCANCLAQEPGDRPSAQHVAETLTASLTASATAGRETAVWVRRARMASVAAVTLATWTAALLWILPDLPPPVAAALSTRTSEPAQATPSASGRTEQHSGALAEPISDADEGSSGKPAPSGSPVPSPSRTASLSPGPSRSPARSPSTDGQRTGGPPDTQAVPTLTQAVGRFDAALEAGESVGSIRADVALDLRQVVHNLLQSLDDPGKGLADVRKKLDERVREGSLSSGVREELERGLTLIGAALERAA